MRSILEANIGEIVKIREDNIPTEFIVIQKGDPFLNNARYENGIYILPKDIPSPAYVGFRDGVVLLRKDIHSVGWFDSYNQYYNISDLHKWCNEEYLNLIQEDIRNAIQPVYIPYSNGTREFVYVGYNGLKCKAFILSMAEVNLTDPCAPSEGVAFTYFKDCEDDKRMANFNDSPKYWWLRTPYTNHPRPAWHIMKDGRPAMFITFEYYGRRPAFVLPESLYVDDSGNVVTNEVA